MTCRPRPGHNRFTHRQRAGQRDRKRACPHTSGSSLSCPTRRARSPIKALDIHTRINEERLPRERSRSGRLTQPLHIALLPVRPL